MKKYNVPMDVGKLQDDAEAIERLRDAYVILRFLGYRMARKAAIESAEKRREFWRKVSEIYPQLAGQKLRATGTNGIWTVEERDETTP